MGEALDHQPRDVGGGLGTAKRGDLDDAALDGGGVVVAVDIIAANHVKDYLDALAAGLLLDDADEVFLAVVNRAGGAAADAGQALLPAPRRCEDPRAEGVRKLDRGGADAGRAAMDEK